MTASTIAATAARVPQTQTAATFAPLKPLGRRAQVLAAIVSHTNRDGIAWPSLARLATLTGMQRPHVNRAIGELEKAGLVSRIGETKNGVRVLQVESHVLPSNRAVATGNSGVAKVGNTADSLRCSIPLKAGELRNSSSRMTPRTNAGQVGQDDEFLSLSSEPGTEQAAPGITTITEPTPQAPALPGMDTESRLAAIESRLDTIEAARGNVERPATAAAPAVEGEPPASAFRTRFADEKPTDAELSDVSGEVQSALVAWDECPPVEARRAVSHGMEMQRRARWRMNGDTIKRPGLVLYRLCRSNPQWRKEPTRKEREAEYTRSFFKPADETPETPREPEATPEQMRATKLVNDRWPTLSADELTRRADAVASRAEFFGVTIGEALDQLSF